MDKDYSDSLFSASIIKSFIVSFILMMIALSIAGFLIEYYTDEKNLIPNGGGIFLLILFLLFLAGPLIYNRRKSRFEKEKILIEKFDGIGEIQGLRGAFYRVIIYEDGIEIRAFYHRYFIPYERIMKISMEDAFLGKRLNITTEIDGMPDYIKSSGKELLSLSNLIKEKVKPGKAAQADTTDRQR